MHFSAHKKTLHGFTLVEMAVVISIVTLISTAMFFNYGKYGVKSELRNLAYRIALEIRTVQALGVGVRGYTSGPQLVFNAHGVWFDISPGGDNKQFDHFVDLDDDSSYDGGAERAETIVFGRGNFISSLCVVPGAGGPCIVPDPNRFGVLFRRPDTDAYFIAPANNGLITYQRVEITIANAIGDTRRIIVYPTGQVDTQ